MTSAHGCRDGTPGLSFQSCALESREGLVKSKAVLAREGLWMLAREGLDEKQAPGDETQASGWDNVRLKARRRSLLLDSAEPILAAAAASLRCWGVSEAALAARRRTGKARGSGDAGGLGESGPPSLESENLSPKRRPPPIVDAAATMLLLLRLRLLLLLSPWVCCCFCCCAAQTFRFYSDCL